MVQVCGESDATSGDVFYASLTGHGGSTREFEFSAGDLQKFTSGQVQGQDVGELNYLTLRQSGTNGLCIKTV